jgi:hypothetical protein
MHSTPTSSIIPKERKVQFVRDSTFANSIPPIGDEIEILKEILLLNESNLESIFSKTQIYLNKDSCSLHFIANFICYGTVIRSKNSQF